MYINKFKCDNPETFVFKEGIAFCKSCNKNVYNSEEIDLTQIMQSGETICASVPASKIAWIERSVLTMGIVAASLVTPIDTFAQNVSALDSILIPNSSNTYKGVFKDENGNSVSQVNIAIFDKDRLLREVINNDDGSFKIEIHKSEILLGNLSMRITPSTNEYLIMRYIEVPNDDLDFENIIFQGKSYVLGGCEGILPNQYTMTYCAGKKITVMEEIKVRDIDKLEGDGKFIKFKDPKSSGATFRREDIRNGIR